MLVLTRKSQERILIGQDVELVVVRIDGDTVRLGIQAPRDVPIMREEVLGRVPPPEPNPSTEAA